MGLGGLSATNNNDNGGETAGRHARRQHKQDAMKESGAGDDDGSKPKCMAGINGDKREARWS